MWLGTDVYMSDLLLTVNFQKERKQYLPEVKIG